MAVGERFHARHFNKFPTGCPGQLLLCAKMVQSMNKLAVAWAACGKLLRWGGFCPFGFAVAVENNGFWYSCSIDTQ